MSEIEVEIEVETLTFRDKLISRIAASRIFASSKLFIGLHSLK